MSQPFFRSKIALVAYLTVLNIAVILGVQLAFGSGNSATAALKPTAPKSAVASQEEQVIALVTKASPAVVSIVAEQKSLTVTTDGNTAPTDIYEEAGRGTGFLVSADGMIVTNRHVAGDRSGKYTVYLADDRKFPAQILDIDPLNDLTLIKIDAKGLPYLEMAPTDDVRVGQTVIAIGNALGQYSNTVTLGILSGVNRSLDAADPRNGQVEQFAGMLQTDAAINSGNSGGPLIDSAGKVIGVNTAVERGGANLGFAIPAAEVRQALKSYAAYGSVARPRLGVRYVMLTPEIAKQEKLFVDYGAYVVADQGVPAVISGSPADAAGIHPRDVILEVNGVKIKDKQTLSKIIQGWGIGDRVKLKVQRTDVVLNLEATLDAHVPYGY